MNRRILVAGTLLAISCPAPAPAPAGAPAIFTTPTIDQDGARATLGDVLTGQITILHFMYPSCRNFCPMSGAVLARTQALLKTTPHQIISISILPRETTPFRLAQWLREHHAAPGWRALFIAQPHLGQVMRGYGETAIDVQLHSSQMMVLNADGRIVRRFDDLPDPARLADAVRQATRRS